MSFPHVYVVEGIILKRKNVGEADRIITLFTREFGKLRLVAKGIRKITSRRAGQLEVFRHIKVQIAKGKTWDVMTEVQTLHSFEGIADDLQKVSFSYYMCELCDSLLPERQQTEDVFYLLRDNLSQLARSVSEIEREAIILAFAIELLRCQGYLPAKELNQMTIVPYIESIIEKKLKSPAMQKKLQG